MKRPGSLFHAIVVVGAALGAGCGDKKPVPDAHTADAHVADARQLDAPATDGGTGDANGDAMVDALIIII